jgi:hypothetical protein
MSSLGGDERPALLRSLVEIGRTDAHGKGVVNASGKLNYLTSIVRSPMKRWQRTSTAGHRSAVS